MLEVAIQRELVEAVRNVGGAATKLSNRFLIGVADVLLKLPRHEAALVEVKTERIIGSKVAIITVHPTLLQLDFLRGFAKAGMRCGVMSTIIRKREFGACLLPLWEFEAHNSAQVLTDDHAWCPMGPDHRRSTMLQELIDFLEGRHGRHK